MFGLAEGDPDEVLAEIRPSYPRRALAVLALAGAGGMLIWTGAAGQTEGAVWKALLVVAGLGGLALALRLWRATAVALELTRRELRESGGRVLCRLDEIEAVDRGAFAFKPSNGLLLRLRDSGPSAWAPGLWWRMGRRIGIGGVTSASQAKAMAQVLTLLRADREAGGD